MRFSQVNDKRLVDVEIHPGSDPKKEDGKSNAG
jgi:hypothetical protein